eukprot:354629_1
MSCDGDIIFLPQKHSKLNMSSFVITALLLVSTTHITLGQTIHTSVDQEFRFGTITCTEAICTVICDTSQGCFTTTIDASSSSDFTLTCIGDSTCRLAIVYCPSNPTSYCNINCGEIYDLTTCANMQVFTPGLDSLSLDCETRYASTTCEDTNIICSTKPSLTRLTHRSPLEFSYDAIGSDGDWLCSRGGCCPFTKGILDCTSQTGACVIDCTIMDCSDYVIDGTATSDLTVNCQASGCIAATIQCPTSSGAQCNVTCKDEKACWGLHIDAAAVDSLHLVCDGTKACLEAAVYCPYHTENACTIDCNSGNEQACFDMRIYSANDYVEGYLSMNCGDNTYSACEDATFVCETDPKESVPLIWGETSSEWKCQYETASYCCPWYNDNNKNEETDASGVISSVTRAAAGSSLVIIVVAVIGALGICCILIILICLCQKRKMEAYARRSAPAPIHQLVPTQPQHQPAVMIAPVGAQVAIPQQNIPVVFVEQMPFNPSGPPVVNASVPPSYQQVQQSHDQPQVYVPEQEEGARAVTNC